MNTPLEIARTAWGADLPDWVEALAAACSRTNQSEVARRLDRSGAVISQILRRVYPAKTDRIEERVRGVLMARTVECPVHGPLATDKCQDWREKAREFVLGSPSRRQMYRACHACPRFKPEGEE
jgi:hypothetical protein